MSPVPAECRVIRSGEAYEGKQGLTYLAGLTGDSVGSAGISMTVLVLPDGARAKTHLHRGIETAVYVIEGRSEMFYGDRLQEHVEAAGGDYVYIPPDVPHLVMNRSGASTRHWSPIPPRATRTASSSSPTSTRSSRGQRGKPASSCANAPSIIAT